MTSSFQGEAAAGVKFVQQLHRENKSQLKWFPPVFNEAWHMALSLRLHDPGCKPKVCRSPRRGRGSCGLPLLRGSRHERVHYAMHGVEWLTLVIWGGVRAQDSDLSSCNQYQTAIKHRDNTSSETQTDTSTQRRRMFPVRLTHSEIAAEGNIRGGINANKTESFQTLRPAKAVGKLGLM